METDFSAGGAPTYFLGMARLLLLTERATVIITVVQCMWPLKYILRQSDRPDRPTDHVQGIYRGHHIRCGVGK